MIRLTDIKPKHIPFPTRIKSENGAHRIAVEWIENGITKSGVYVPRRDTSSRINNVVGDRLFPGKHYMAKFDVEEFENIYRVSFTSSDDTVVSVDTIETTNFNQESIFENLETASAFFKCGAVGYSPAKNKYDGIELRTEEWKVKPLKVSSCRSSFFEDKKIFPEGSIKFDNALLMTNIKHEWHSVDDIKDTSTSE